MRPRSPLAWLLTLWPATTMAVVLATGHHFVLDAAVGAACVAAGAAAAWLVHGRVPRGRAEVGRVRIALAAGGFGAVAHVANPVVLGLVV